MSERSVDIGDSLRATREKLGWSLEDVAHRTRIPLATLRQLEENHYANFPSRTYAKSFLTQYSDYLGLDTTEFLDEFETGNVLADLDSYEYLKDHDERIDAAPLTLKPPPSEKPKVRKEKSPRSPRPASLQPLLVFTVTALLITGAVFGFMKLSNQFADDPSESAAKEDADETLAPVTGLLEGRPDRQDFSQVPPAIPVDSENLVAGDPNSALRNEPLGTPPPTPDDIAADFSLDDPPPRAVIVEE